MTATSRPLTQTELLVVDALEELGEASGAEIGRAARLGAGRLYPLLAALEALGKVTSRTPDGYPRVTRYRLR